MSQSIDELMEDLDVDTPNDIAAKEIKHFKRVVIESIDISLIHILNKKLKRKISKRKILKRKILKRKILKRKIP